MPANLTPQDLPETVWIWIAKGLGATLGSAVSIAYALPRGRREAAIRFIVGVILGITFGPASGVRIAGYFGVGEDLSRVEIALMGATAASLCAWWALGMMRNVFAGRFKLRSAENTTN